MALSGSFHKYPVGQFGLYCEWSAKQSAIGNYSDVTLKTYLRYYSINVGSRSDSTVTIGSTTETYTTPAIKHSPGAYTNKLLKTKTVRINHDSGGKASVKLSAYWRFDGTYSGTYVGGITASSTVTLNTIDRTAPTVSVTVDSISTSSAAITATASATCDLWQYSIDGGSTWTDFSDTAGTKAAATISGLSPNTQYNIMVRARKQSNQVYGSSTVAAKTIGGAVINSVSPIIADNSIVTIDFNWTVFSSAYTYTLAVSTDSGDIISIDIPTQSSAGTADKSLTLASTQRAALLSAIPSTSKSIAAAIVFYVKDSSGAVGNPQLLAVEIQTTAANSAPTFSDFSYSDVNSLTKKITGDSKILIQNYSYLRAVATAATAKNGAASSQYEATINGTAITSSGTTLNCGNIGTSGEVTLTVKAIDSRGYSTAISKVVTVVEYEKVDLVDVAVRRVNDVEALTRISLEARISPIMIADESKNAVQEISYRFKKTSEEEYSEYIAVSQEELTVSGGTVTFDGAEFASFDTDYSYDIQIRMSDKLTSDTYTVTIPQGVPLISKRRKCVGINNRNPRSALDVIGEVMMNNQNVQGYVRTLESGSTLDDVTESGIYYGVDVPGIMEVITIPETFSMQRYTTTDMHRLTRIKIAESTETSLSDVEWGAWHYEDFSGVTSWKKAALASPAEHYSGNEVMYYKRDGVVYLRGWFTGWSSSLTTTLFTLPEGYRPGQEMNFVVNVSGTGSGTAYVARLQILTDGIVRVGAESVLGQIAKGCSACIPPFLAEN